MNRRQPLLLISRSDMLEACNDDGGERLVRKLAKLTRRGVHVLSVASQPEEWNRNRAVSRRSLPRARTLRARVSEAGGHLDGVYYIPRSVLTQKKNREDALRDMMERFNTTPDSVRLLSSSKKLLKAARGLGIESSRISAKSPLRILLKNLDTGN